MKKYYWLRANDTSDIQKALTDVSKEFLGDPELDLAVMQHMVGGRIELMTCTPGGQKCLWVDEYGGYKGEKYARVYLRPHERYMREPQLILGNILFQGLTRDEIISLVEGIDPPSSPIRDF